MRTVILQEFVTLDGLAAAANGSVDFVPAATRGDKSLGQDQLALIDSIDTILLGRITYEMFAGYWPKVTDGDDQFFAHKLNATPKIVFSKTLERAPWGTWDEARVVRSGAAQEIAKLKQQPGRNLILWGSISLAQSLINERLIDEYRLMVCPVVLGRGRPLFPENLETLEMKLLKVKPYDRGTVQLKYVQDKTRTANTVSLAGETAAR
jgi:dihydrofolate reductase